MTQIPMQIPYEILISRRTVRRNRDLTVRSRLKHVEIEILTVRLRLKHVEIEIFNCTIAP